MARSRFQGLWATPDDQVQLSAIERNTVNGEALRRVVQHLTQHNTLVECDEMWAAHRKQQESSSASAHSETADAPRNTPESLADARQREELRRIAAKGKASSETASGMLSAETNASVGDDSAKLDHQRKLKKRKQEKKKRKYEKTDKKTKKRKRESKTGPKKHKRGEREDSPVPKGPRPSSPSSSSSFDQDGQTPVT